jgi:hypothetical protein
MGKTPRNGLVVLAKREGCGGDALGPVAEEGRGERRNVDGELQASDEPSESEWGNPAVCEHSYRRRNP